MKTCATCKVPKELTDFCKDSKKKDGLSSYCNPCRRSREKLAYLKHRDKVRKRQKKYNLSNKEKISEKCGEYYQNNKEKILEKAKKYRENNKTAIKGRDSSYRKRNRPRLNALSNKYRASKLRATPPWLTEDQIAEIEQFYWLANDLYKTTGELYHVDHIVPLQGKDVSGLHVPWNLQILPSDLNLRKGTKYD